PQEHLAAARRRVRGDAADRAQRDLQHRRGAAAVPAGDLGGDGDRARHVPHRHARPRNGLRPGARRVRGRDPPARRDGRAGQRGDGPRRRLDCRDLRAQAGDRGGGARAVRNMTARAMAAPSAAGVVAVSTAIYFLDGLIHTILGPLAPDIARSLSLGNAELGPIFSSNLVGQCLGLVVFPAIASRFGHRITVTLAVAGFALGQAARALATDGTSLFAIRLVTGVFLGGCLPSCLAIVTAQAPARRRGLSILALFTGYGLGAAVAGIVSAGFADHGGWRAAMVAVGALSFLAAGAAWVWLRDGGPAEARPREMSGPPAALQILAPRYLVGTTMLWLLFIVMLTISYCLNSWLPIMLVEVGHDESFAALSITIFGFGGAIAALGVGALIDRFGAMPVLIGFLAAAAAFLFAAGQVIATAPATTLAVL